MTEIEEALACIGAPCPQEEGPCCGHSLARKIAIAYRETVEERDQARNEKMDAANVLEAFQKAESRIKELEAKLACNNCKGHHLNLTLCSKCAISSHILGEKISELRELVRVKDEALQKLLHGGPIEWQESIINKALAMKEP